MRAKRRPSSPSRKAQRRDVGVLSWGADAPVRVYPSWRSCVIETMHARIVATIRKIPRGKVSTYGAIARAAGYPGAARQVVAALHRGFDLPWQRVLGAGGEIKLRGDSAIEQRLRLESEGIAFRGRRANMKQHEFKFPRVKNRTAVKRRKKKAGRPPSGRQTANGRS
jgi:methylated-DNA-protein-cysteine methyltransferase related protein